MTGADCSFAFLDRCGRSQNTFRHEQVHFPCQQLSAKYKIEKQAIQLNWSVLSLKVCIYTASFKALGVFPKDLYTN